MSVNANKKRSNDGNENLRGAPVAVTCADEKQRAAPGVVACARRELVTRCTDAELGHEQALVT